MNEISMAISSAKAALDFVTGIIGLNKKEAIREKAEELFAIIDSLRQRIYELESQIFESNRLTEKWRQKALNKEAWDQKIKSYATHEPTPGVRVYVQKAFPDLSEQAEWYCKHCADVGSTQSTFQLVHHSALGKQFGCHKCGFKFLIPEKTLNGGHRVKPRDFI